MWSTRSDGLDRHQRDVQHADQPRGLEGQAGLAVELTHEALLSAADQRMYTDKAERRALHARLSADGEVLNEDVFDHSFETTLIRTATRPPN